MTHRVMVNVTSETPRWSRLVLLILPSLMRVTMLKPIKNKTSSLKTSSRVVIGLVKTWYEVMQTTIMSEIARQHIIQIKGCSVRKIATMMKDIRRATWKKKQGIAEILQCFKSRQSSFTYLMYPKLGQVSLRLQSVGGAKMTLRRTGG